MKIIAIGDTHGRANWKNIVANTEFDKVVFIGDYFDTHEKISPGQQKDNFREIIAYKELNSDKVVLLFGNHDYHYLDSVNETYSGYQQWQQTDIKELLHGALDQGLMQMCFVHMQYLFSHAGVTKTWCRNVLGNENPNKNVLETIINDMLIYQPLSFKFTPGTNYSEYGDDICQTPIWVRPNSLFKDALPGYVHVVGHTVQAELKITPNVILIDTLATSGQYLSIIDGKPYASDQLS